MKTSTITVPTVAINYVINMTIPTDKAARKLATEAACQEVNRAVNAWLYEGGCR